MELRYNGDGNDARSSLKISDEESETESKNEELGNSSEGDEDPDNEIALDEVDEADTTDVGMIASEDDDQDEVEGSGIPVIVGNRPSQMVTEIRVTVRRSNKLIDALSVPRMTLYNVRLAWAKWKNMAEDMDTRSIDLSFYTEVLHKVENKNHQKAIENILGIKGIQYISIPRPGPRRGGGTALACSQQNFQMNKYFCETHIYNIIQVG